jgi:hypothetical protein
VFVTPEYLTGEGGVNLMKQLATRVSLAVIDESHCISQWGHDFRPSYRRLDCIRRTLLDIPILAVMATAKIVRYDIQHFSLSFVENKTILIINEWQFEFSNQNSFFCECNTQALYSRNNSSFSRNLQNADNRG